MSEKDSAQELLTISEAAEFTGVTVDRMLQWANASVFPLHGPGGDDGRLVAKASLNDLMAHVQDYWASAGQDARP